MGSDGKAREGNIVVCVSVRWSEWMRESVGVYIEGMRGGGGGGVSEKIVDGEERGELVVSGDLV